jgi:hypothetical protein
MLHIRFLWEAVDLSTNLRNVSHRGNLTEKREIRSPLY